MIAKYSKFSVGVKWKCQSNVKNEIFSYQNDAKSIDSTSLTKLLALSIVHTFKNKTYMPRDNIFGAFNEKRDL